MHLPGRLLLHAVGWLAALLWLPPSASAQTAADLQPVPALTARVSDQTASLDPAQRQRLEAKLAAFEAERGTQILILLVSTTQPEDIAAYANRIFNNWKPGRPGIGDGLLLVVATQDRKVRIEVGRTLEGIIPDLAAKRVIDDVLTPNFRQGDFAGGLDQATDQLMALLRGEALPPPVPTRPPAQAAWLNLLLLLLVALPVIGSVTRRLLGNKLGSLISGGLIGIVTFSFTASLLLAVVSALLATLLTFLAGTPLGAAILSSGRQRHQGGPWGSHPGAYTSGGWGGGFGGGGGFSSGGGGDGAGGGASGDW